MSNRRGGEKPRTGRDVTENVAELLGGRRTIGAIPKTSLEAHEMLRSGLPARALRHFVTNLEHLNWNSAFEAALGMSQRTYQRHKSVASKPLSPDQTARTWKLVEILAKTTTILGTKEEAERWLERPAIGLDGRRPIDLLATPAGVELVEEFLLRLEHGVYV